MQEQRIVATGAGVISPLGAGLADFERALFEGACGIRPAERFGGAMAAEVVEFNTQQWLGNKGIRVLDRSARLLAIAARMALCATGWEQDQAEQGDPGLGMVCGTLFGSVHSIATFDWSGITEGVNYVNPMEFPNTVINSPAGQSAIKHKLRGVNSTLCAGLASGLYGLSYAADFLRFGRAKALLAGGVEELCEESVLGFRKMGLASPSGAVRPFAENRDGTVPGEASALFMLETAEAASVRGATPWFEVLGFGCAHDAHSILGYQTRADGAAAAISQALENSGIGADDIACIAASANGSRSGDEMELRALCRVFGSRLAEIPAAAPKAMLGECMGTGGALTALTAALSLKQQRVPPTPRGGQPQGGPRLSAEAQPFEGEYALVNAFSCDGNNASLVIRLWKN